MARKPTGRPAGRPRKTRPGHGAGRARSHVKTRPGLDAGAGTAEAENPPRPVELVAPATAPAVAVEVDQAQLSAEAAAITATVQNTAQDVAQDVAAPALDAPAAPARNPQEAANALRPLVAAATGVVANNVLPNWHITDSERSEFTDAAALALGYWLPDDTMEPKWAALLALLAVSYNITSRRYDSDTGRLKPLRVPPKRDERPQVGEAVDVPPAKPPGDAPAPLRL